MYQWKLLAHDTSQGPLCSGMGGDLAQIMRATEALLTKPTGFVAQITEVVPRMSVLHLGSVHVPTGREWLGRRDTQGGVRWQARYRPADPDVVGGVRDDRTHATQDLHRAPAGGQLRHTPPRRQGDGRPWLRRILPL
jgi:hypothetical protein